MLHVRGIVHRFDEINFAFRKYYFSIITRVMNKLAIVRFALLI